MTPYSAMPRAGHGQWRIAMAIAAVFALTAGLLTIVAPGSAGAAVQLLSQGAPATSSSAENAEFSASAAVDGNPQTRWSSQFADNQWLEVDLGRTATIDHVEINWEAAHAKTFTIQASEDGSTWTDITPVTSGNVGDQVVDTDGVGQFVRLNGITRATPWGFSLYEFEVYGEPTTSQPPTDPPTSDTPDFGPNVQIFDSSTPATEIQSAVDEAFNSRLLSADAQFGNARDVFLFEPGTYGRVFANVGFYTTLAGLGRNPDDVTIEGAINVDAGWNLGDESNATQNFWRSVENLSVRPEGGTNRWAVSQAAPMRRVHILGNLTMGPSNQDFGQGYSSGGYIADSKIDGDVSSGSQQQWYTRNSTIGSWTGGNWNMTFSGVQGAPAQGFPDNSYTTLDTTPTTREKPYLYIDDDGNYSVFVPALQQNSSGVTWPDTPGESIPMSQFYVARPSDSTATLNQALAGGLNLYFTPGVYTLTETLQITRPDTIVTGIGYPTLIPEGGIDGMTIADVSGVSVSSILFDAGTENSDALLTVGTDGAHIDHSANPTFIQDVFFRIGGAVAGKATQSLVVNSDDTVLDHIWAWRADHGNSPTGFTINTADTGTLVNGDDVLATGLFVEHYQKYQVLWNGERGRTIFFQNEMPYDPVTQDQWTSPTGPGYAAYKVADSVSTHELWGGGVYCFFNVNPDIVAARGFEAPITPGVRFHNIITVSLGDVGTITNVINDTGGAVPWDGGNTAPRQVVSYP